MPDPRIVPGAWVKTRFGKAVCVAVQPHDHCLVMREPRPGYVITPCESDACAGAQLVSYRYRAHRCRYDANSQFVGYEEKPIWVYNGDLTAGPDAVTFLAPPTRFTARIVKLEGPYGEG